MTTQEATVLDGTDPLQGFRDRFLIPRHGGEEQAYFCGMHEPPVMSCCACRTS